METVEYRESSAPRPPSVSRTEPSPWRISHCTARQRTLHPIRPSGKRTQRQMPRSNRIPAILRYGIQIFNSRVSFPDIAEGRASLSVSRQESRGWSSRPRNGTIFEPRTPDRPQISLMRRQPGRSSITATGLRPRSWHGLVARTTPNVNTPDMGSKRKMHPRHSCARYPRAAADLYMSHRESYLLKHQDARGD